VISYLNHSPSSCAGHHRRAGPGTQVVSDTTEVHLLYRYTKPHCIQTHRSKPTASNDLANALTDRLSVCGEKSAAEV